MIDLHPLHIQRWRTIRLSLFAEPCGRLPCHRITDSCRSLHLDFILPRVRGLPQDLEVYPSRPGRIEITMCPCLIPGLVKEATPVGAKIIVVHGETIVEPVAAGTTGPP